MKLPLITEEKDIKGKRVIIRVDCNVPFEKGVIVDDFRIQKILPTLYFLRDAGAKILIVSHIGREKTDSLLPVSVYLEKFFPHTFVANFETYDFSQMKKGEALLFENIRQWDGEKSGDENFAKKLGATADIYVNEAFAVSHRKDASVYVLPKFLPSYFGPLFAEEVKNLSIAFEKHSPYLFLLGGAKFETKLPLIQKFITVADTIFVGGALANNFFKLQGFNIGDSLIDEMTFDLKPLAEEKKLILPIDVVVDGKVVRKPYEIGKTETIRDIGPETVKILEGYIAQAKFILWNGPFGNYEEGYDEATVAIAKAVEKSMARVVLGGGDTVAAIEKCHISNETTFISTGGGAMLDFLANGTLPGIDAIMKK